MVQNLISLNETIYGPNPNFFDIDHNILNNCKFTKFPMNNYSPLTLTPQSMRQNPKILKQEMPKSAAEVYFLIGKCHVESGNYPSALEALNGAIRINPAYSEVGTI